MAQAQKEEEEQAAPEVTKPKKGPGRKKQDNDEYIQKTQAKIDEVIEEYRLARLNNTSS